jgi:tRNA dimethylallyltransferase
MMGIGYKELLAHLRGEISLQEAIEQIKRNTRRYAKRQMTWFRKYEDAVLITLDEKGNPCGEIL